MLIKSIIYRALFILISGLSLGLSYWQVRRAQREELRETIQPVRKEDLVLEQTWIYERPDRKTGVYYIVSDGKGEHFCIEKEDWDLSIGYRKVLWSVPAWCDRQNLHTASFERKIETLSALVLSLEERGNVARARLLRPEWSARERAVKRHRHYAYAVQWGGLALASSLYWLKRSERERPFQDRLQS